jgi:hypothetical protein
MAWAVPGRADDACGVRRHGVCLPPDGPLPPPLQAAVNRTALRRCLAEYGLLEYTSYWSFARRACKAQVDENGRTS